MIAIVFAVMFLMLFIIKGKHDHSLKSFCMMQLSMITWMVFKVFKTVAPTTRLRWLCVVCYYAGAIAFEVAFLSFTYTQYNKRPLKKSVLFLFISIAIAQFIVVLTNPIHYMFYSDFDFYDDHFGGLFYMHSVIAYSFVFAGMYYGAKHFHKVFQKESKVFHVVMAIAILSPFVMNYLYISKILHRFFEYIGIPVIFDVTPIVFVITISIFVYATYHYDYLELTPIMKWEVVEKLDTAIALVDSEGMIMYRNQKMEQYIQANKKLNINVEVCKNRNVQINGRYYQITIAPLTQQRIDQYLMMVYDMTDYFLIENRIKENHRLQEEIQKDLLETIKQLKKASKEKARIYVAKELHDIIGHSFVVAIKSLEVSLMYVKQDQKLSKECLNEACFVLEKGAYDLRMLLEEKDHHLENTIEEYCKRLEKIGVETYVNLKGQESSVDDIRKEIVLKVIQEFITNSIKHGHASMILIEILIDPTLLKLRLMDNGVGCDDLKLGNGMKGMIERIESVQGEVIFKTEAHNGFILNAKIELNENQ